MFTGRLASFQAEPRSQAAGGSGSPAEVLGLWFTGAAASRPHGSVAFLRALSQEAQRSSARRFCQRHRISEMPVKERTACPLRREGLEDRTEVAGLMWKLPKGRTVRYPGQLPTLAGSAHHADRAWPALQENWRTRSNT